MEKKYISLHQAYSSMLTDTFLHLTSKYNNDKVIAKKLWLEIFSKYSDPNRFYHTTEHLGNLITELKKIQNKILDWDTTLLAVFYHDIIYKASSNINKEDSAKLSLKRLAEINYPIDKTANCYKMILATKQHITSTDNDINYLLDADLSILGQPPYEYQIYTEKIRKEYSLYSDFKYTQERKKTIVHFLNKEKIFTTDHFNKKYEIQARINLNIELVSLKK